MAARTSGGGFLEPLAQGRSLGAFCLTEASGGSDVPAMRMRATADGEDFVLNGEKVFVTNGDRADVFLTFARTEPEREREGISLFAVERGSPGLSVLRLEDKMGLRASATAQLVYDGVRVPRANLVGELNDGFGMALTTLNYSRIGIGAMCLGVGRRALELAWGYAHERAMFGGTLADQQVTRHAFADMEGELFAAESMIYRTAAMADAEQPVEAEAVDLQGVRHGGRRTGGRPRAADARWPRLPARLPRSSGFTAISAWRASTRARTRCSATTSTGRCVAAAAASPRPAGPRRSRQWTGWSGRYASSCSLTVRMKSPTSAPSSARWSKLVARFTTERTPKEPSAVTRSSRRIASVVMMAT